MTSYTYCVYETDKGSDGLCYIGSRRCPEGEVPETDSYMGSSSDSEFRSNPNRIKDVLGVFENHEDALNHEIYLHGLWKVATNPGFANKSELTSTKFSMGGRELLDTHRSRISEAHKGENNFMFGKRGFECPRFGVEHSEEAKEKISGNHADISGEKNPNWAREFSDQHRSRIAKNHADISGVNNPRHDPTLYDFENIGLGLIELQITKLGMKKKHNTRTKCLGYVISGKYSHHMGWSLLGRVPKSKVASPGARARMSANHFDSIGENNPFFDSTLYDFVNRGLGIQEIQVTRNYMSKKYDLGVVPLKRVAEGKQSQHKGWTTPGGPEPRIIEKKVEKPAHQLYDFENRGLGLVELQVSRRHMVDKYNLRSRSLGRVIYGHQISHLGWSLLSE